MVEDPDEDDAPDGRSDALFALGITVLLVIGGWVLIHELRDTSRLQDCVMSGRTNCAPIDTAALDR
jgi:hypothetical protein